jgi:hypothetical protein
MSFFGILHATLVFMIDIFFISLGGVRLSPLGTSATVGLVIDTTSLLEIQLHALQIRNSPGYSLDI